MESTRELARAISFLRNVAFRRNKLSPQPDSTSTSPLQESRTPSDEEPEERCNSDTKYSSTLSPSLPIVHMGQNNGSIVPRQHQLSVHRHFSSSSPPSSPTISASNASRSPPTGSPLLPFRKSLQRNDRSNSDPQLFFKGKATLPPSPSSEKNLKQAKNEKFKRELHSYTKQHSITLPVYYEKPPTENETDACLDLMAQFYSFKLGDHNDSYVFYGYEEERSDVEIYKRRYKSDAKRMLRVHRKAEHLRQAILL